MEKEAVHLDFNRDGSSYPGKMLCGSFQDAISTNEHKEMRASDMRYGATQWACSHKEELVGYCGFCVNCNNDEQPTSFLNVQNPLGSFSPSDWIIPSPPTITKELDESDIHVPSPPTPEVNEHFISSSSVIEFKDVLLERDGYEYLIIPPPPPLIIRDSQLHLKTFSAPESSTHYSPISLMSDVGTCFNPSMRVKVISPPPIRFTEASSRQRKLSAEGEQIHISKEASRNIARDSTKESLKPERILQDSVHDCPLELEEIERDSVELDIPLYVDDRPVFSQFLSMHNKDYRQEKAVERGFELSNRLGSNLQEQRLELKPSFLDAFDLSLPGVKVTDAPFCSKDCFGSSSLLNADSLANLKRDDRREESAISRLSELPNQELTKATGVPYQSIEVKQLVSTTEVVESTWEYSTPVSTLTAHLKDTSEPTPVGRKNNPSSVPSKTGRTVEFKRSKIQKAQKGMNATSDEVTRISKEHNTPKTDVQMIDITEKIAATKEGECYFQTSAQETNLLPTNTQQLAVHPDSNNECVANTRTTKNIAHISETKPLRSSNETVHPFQCGVVLLDERHLSAERKSEHATKDFIPKPTTPCSQKAHESNLLTNPSEGNSFQSWISDNYIEQSDLRQNPSQHIHLEESFSPCEYNTLEADLKDTSAKGKRQLTNGTKSCDTSSSCFLHLVVDPFSDQSLVLPALPTGSSWLKRTNSTASSAATCADNPCLGEPPESQSPHDTPPPLPESSPPSFLLEAEDCMYDFDFCEPERHITSSQKCYCLANDCLCLNLRRSFSDSVLYKRAPLEFGSSTKKETSAVVSSKSSRHSNNVPQDRDLWMPLKDIASDQEFNPTLPGPVFELHSLNSSSRRGTPPVRAVDELSFTSHLTSGNKSLKFKCGEVCQESISRMSVLKQKLDVCLANDVQDHETSKTSKNWPMILQNNARFLACDVKVMSASVKRSSPQALSAMQTSLESLERLVDSCECFTLCSTPKNIARTLVVLVTQVLAHYCDVVVTVEPAIGQSVDDPNVDRLMENTATLTTLIASLIRTLRNI